MESSVKGNPRIGTHAARIQGNEGGRNPGLRGRARRPFWKVITLIIWVGQSMGRRGTQRGVDGGVVRKKSMPRRD